MRIDQLVLFLAAMVLITGLTGCGGGVLGAQPYVRSGTANLAEASVQATQSLITELDGTQGVVGKLQALTGTTTRRVVVDPMIDGIASQQTALSRDLERRVIDKAHELRPGLDFHSLAQDSGPNGDLLLTGTISPERQGNSLTPGSFVIRLALTDLKTNKIVAQASASGRDTSLDITPSGFHQDSPAVLTDKVTEGYVRTAGTPTGQDADATYIRELPSSAAIARGTDSYNKGDYAQALGHFQKSVLLDPSGEQLRASTGLYLTNVKLGHPDQAEQAFTKLIALGLANHNLGLKFLFNPGTTDFVSDRGVSVAAQYPVWVRQIARGIERARVCVDVVGHSSHSGVAEANDRLSAQRAERVRQRLITEVPAIGGLTSARGLGSRENIIGTGTDDLRDAVDRRVEFKVRSCTAA